MAVIPLILTGANRTVVKTRLEFENSGGLGGNVALIEQMDATQLEATDNANISYDLRVGERYRQFRDAGSHELPRGKEIRLLPGTAVIVVTEERICLPGSMFGHIVPKVDMLQKGITNTASKIDPGYNGNLLVTVFNLSKHTVKLKRGDAFCSVYLLQVLQGARLYQKQAKTIVGKAVKGFWGQVRDWLEANAGLLTAILIIIYILQELDIVRALLALFR